MTMNFRLSGKSAVLIGTALITACGGSGPTAPEPPQTGVMSLAVSDAPVQDARQVCVEFDEAIFQKAGSDQQVVSFDPPVKVDLLAYQGMNSAPLVVDATLEAGEYQWIRLAVNAPQGGGGGAGAGSNDTECTGGGSYIVTDTGAVHGLYIPSGAESGLQLNRGFTLPVGGEADFVAEFDLMKSVHMPRGLDSDYVMRPVVHLLDRTATGSIGGEVAAELATATDCAPAVFLYNTGDVPDDNEDDAESDSIDPIASAMVEMQADGRYTYEIGPVLEGMYDLAFSCDADDPELDETLEYVMSADNPVEVLAGEEEVANFEAPGPT